MCEKRVLDKRVLTPHQKRKRMECCLQFLELYGENTDAIIKSEQPIPKNSRCFLSSERSRRPSLAIVRDCWQTIKLKGSILLYHTMPIFYGSEQQQLKGKMAILSKGVLLLHDNAFRFISLRLQRLPRLTAVLKS
ncbi:hypothetical protein EVAR_2231_1 [Eumeta japonica]|uniref:Uncharacterized protein n=1 Tax=Eumeta variegata TaxID=151549 RepID=A0A4C1SFP0_EUMVA|nr:hypothetical protein EVAR_2231_1 [Eumeta japonica]